MNIRQKVPHTRRKREIPTDRCRTYVTLKLNQFLRASINSSPQEVNMQSHFREITLDARNIRREIRGEIAGAFARRDCGLLKSTFLIDDTRPSPDGRRDMYSYIVTHRRNDFLIVIARNVNYCPIVSSVFCPYAGSFRYCFANVSLSRAALVN